MVIRLPDDIRTGLNKKQQAQQKQSNANRATIWVDAYAS
jgi:hypothetical protein